MASVVSRCMLLTCTQKGICLRPTVDDCFDGRSRGPVVFNEEGTFGANASDLEGYLTARGKL
jgi:hypothetical protein